MRRPFFTALYGSALFCALAPLSVQAQGFLQTNLVSDGSVPASFTDPNLANPWGISLSGGSPFWVSDNKTGVSTLYNSIGSPQALVVTIPGVGGNPGSPTGQVFNSTASDFQVTGGGVTAKAAFIFSTEDGTIAGWSPTVNLTNAIQTVNPNGGVYKGLALGSTGGSNFLYAANFNSGNIDVFDKNFAPATLTGSFTDSGIPAGYAPFNVQKLGSKLYVTYALQDSAKHDDVNGAGHGFVDVYNLDGTFDHRIATGGKLDSPWGLAIAPTGFGKFGGDLLGGNFGDGSINAYDPNGTDAFVGTLTDIFGNPLNEEGLWGLSFGNGGNGGSKNSLYFTAGLGDPPGSGQNIETHGLFGRLDAVPEPSAWAFALLGAGSTGLLLRRRRK